MPWLFWLVVDLVAGLLPSGLFFVWVDLLAHQPEWARSISSTLGGRTFVESTWMRVLFDVGLFSAFGLVHTGLAQVAPQQLLKKVLGNRGVRPFYVAVTGLALLGVMAAWQPLPGTLWTFVDAVSADRVGALVYWLVMLRGITTIAGAEPLKFLGVAPDDRGAHAPEPTTGTLPLRTTGLYRFVRHPGYALVALGFLCANRMTVDRFVIFFAKCLYLVVGIPIEERKLIVIFGEAYRDYRRSVPALVPLGFLRRQKRTV
jgi:hypothetical protein